MTHCFELQGCARLCFVVFCFGFFYISLFLSFCSLCHVFRMLFSNKTVLESVTLIKCELVKLQTVIFFLKNAIKQMIRGKIIL